MKLALTYRNTKYVLQFIKWALHLLNIEACIEVARTTTVHKVGVAYFSGSLVLHIYL